MMQNQFSENDKKFMNLALNLARKNVGLTAENPSVGCVIVKDNIILSSAVTNFGGRPHAENIAINKIANQDLKNSTIYVTLEPCSHFGKTEPCVDLIIAKKISRVVIAAQDPDLRVNGNAIKKLKENNISIEIGLLENEAKEINRGFFKAKTVNQPFVTLKLATSLDGKIATKNFDSKWITNEKSRQFGHLLRSQNNAILIGANSVKKDNPALDCRILGLEKFSPIRIVLTSTLDLDLNWKIFQDQQNIRTYVATNSKEATKIALFEKANIEVINFDNLKNLLSKLTKIGINNLLIEGGGFTASSFINEGLIDEIIHFQSNKILGSDAISAIGDLNLDSLNKAPIFNKVKSWNFDEDQVTIWQKNR